jgi:hypothetical protein
MRSSSQRAGQPALQDLVPADSPNVSLVSVGLLDRPVRRRARAEALDALERLDRGVEAVRFAGSRTSSASPSS